MAGQLMAGQLMACQRLPLAPHYFPQARDA